MTALLRTLGLQLAGALLPFVAVALFLLAGCTPCPEIVADVTVQLDGGATQVTTSTERCAVECVTSADCPKGQHCSQHPLDPKGLCFDDVADGGQ